jgi:YidC/Oxa1 family membrane protein insertase
MDKKNFSIGALLLVAAFALMFFGPKSPPPTTPATAPSTATPAAPNPASTATPVEATATSGAVASSTSASTSSNAPATINLTPTEAQITTLSNEFIEARFTPFGGALSEVAFKKYPAVQGESAPYLFNHLHEDPLLALGDYPGLGRGTQYQLVSSSAAEVVYRAVLDGRIEVTRTYRLTDPSQPGSDPYRVRHETTFRNLGDATIPLPRATLSLGTVTLINERDDGMYLTVAAHDGEDQHYIERNSLEGGGFFALFGSPRPATPVLEQPRQVVWAAAKNKFFTGIYSPDAPGVALIAKRIELPSFPNAARPNTGLTGAVRFELPALAANGTATMTGTLYIGPLEYKRLAEFENNQDRVLPYTQYFFNRIFLSGYVAPLLNQLLNAVHGWVNDWGLAVIIMTIILKFVSLPFTLKASKSAKQMAKLQPELQVIREKFKDNPQKQQAATMEVFKKHKVNPIGGCIPILITMPLFIGFFAMLQSPPELRFQSFLWARDLSAPDTVGHLFGLPWLPINIMPLLMGATMYYQMRLTPTPSVDNMQMKMMRFMPVIFTLFCYQFSCALALYSTVNGIFTIVQQIIVNRTKDEPGPTSPGAAAATTAAAFGKKNVKNVTPKKK